MKKFLLSSFCCFFSPTDEPTKISSPAPLLCQESQFLKKLVDYARSNMSSNIFFILACDDLICNPDNITVEKLKIFQKIFLSYKEEYRKSKLTIIECKYKFIVNFDNKTVDIINQEINKITVSSLGDTGGLLKLLNDVCHPLVPQALSEYKDETIRLDELQTSNQKTTSLELTSTAKESDETLKILAAAGFIIIQQDKEKLKTISLFSNRF